MRDLIPQEEIFYFIFTSVDGEKQVMEIKAPFMAEANRKATEFSKANGVQGVFCCRVRDIAPSLEKSD